MDDFLKNNKVLIIIVIVAFVIGGWLYYSNQHRLTSFSNERVYNNSSQSVSSGCILYTQAGNFVGEVKCVYGKVVDTYVSKKGNVFIDFCQDYKTCPFSAVIFQSDVSKFSGLDRYQGSNIELTGLIKTYQGRPEIIINEPKQIKIR